MRLFYFFILIFLNFNLLAQEEVVKISLSEVIALAQSDAPEVLINKTQLSNNFWQYQNALSLQKPTVRLNSDLPNLNRSIGLITLPTGRDTFIQRAQMQNTVGLELEQWIPWTGGTVRVGTRLERLDIFNAEDDEKKSYFASPISIGFSQSLFGFNELKWNNKIAPLAYTEATKEFAENMENVAFRAAELFFDLYIAQLNLETAHRDKSNADTLLSISKGRFEVGRIAETELLQIELSAMNANADLARATLELSSATEELRNFLGIKRAIEFELAPPTDIPEFNVNVEEALKYAIENRSEIVGFERRKIEAESNVARAKANSGLNATLSGNFNISKTAKNLSNVYEAPFEDNERFSLGLNVPIADWGRAKSRLEVAKSNQEVTNMLVEQERISFEREIVLQVQQFDLVRNQVALALRAYEVAQERQKLTRNRYFIGKIGITELGIAISEQESARRGYMSALQNFWLAFYKLRKTTLFDFERNVSLVKRVDFED